MNKPSNSQKTNINQEIDELKSNDSETRPANNSWELELQTIDHTEAQHFRGSVSRGNSGNFSAGRINAGAILCPSDYCRLSAAINH